MGDVFTPIIENAAAFRWLLFLAFAWVVYRVVESTDGVEWADFIATKGVDEKYHGDWDKIGKGTAVICGSWVIVAIAPNVKADFLGFAAVLAAYFTFTGAVAGWAAYLRSKSGRVETVTVVTPMAKPGPEKTTTTRTEPALSAPSEVSPVPVEIVNGAGIQKPLSVKQTDDNPEKEKS